MTGVKFAIPKGSLEEAVFALMEKSWTKVYRKSRTYRVTLDDPQITVKMLRPQEIPTLSQMACMMLELQAKTGYLRQNLT